MSYNDRFISELKSYVIFHDDWILNNIRYVSIAQISSSLTVDSLPSRPFSQLAVIYIPLLS